MFYQSITYKVYKENFVLSIAIFHRTDVRLYVVHIYYINIYEDRVNAHLFYSNEIWIGLVNRGVASC